MLKKRGRDDSPKIEKNNNKKIKTNDDEDDFQALGIDERISDKLKANSIVSLFDVQKAVFKPVYKNQNIIVASLTGSGKTLSFVLPLVQKAIDENKFKSKSPYLMVITPTRELSVQVASQFTDLSSNELSFKTVLIYGGVSIEDQSKIIIKLVYKLRSGAQIIVGTPGRIVDMIERGELNLKNIDTVVLDEADKMLSMGFQEQIENIFNKIYEHKEKIQVCLFSATIESWVKSVADKITRGNELKYIDLVKDLGGRTPKTVQHLAVNCLKSDKLTTIADLSISYLL